MARQPAPAFLLYARDLVADQADLTLEQVGAFSRLLAHSWLRVGLPDDVPTLQRMIGATSEDVVTTVLRLHFERHDRPDGARWTNRRQEEERRKQAKFRRQQQINGRISAQRRLERRSNGGSTPVTSERQRTGNIASSSACASDHTHGPRARTFPDPHRACASCGRPCLPRFLADEFSQALGGLKAEADSRVARWAETVREAHAGLEIAPGPAFWRRAWSETIESRRVSA